MNQQINNRKTENLIKKEKNKYRNRNNSYTLVYCHLLHILYTYYIVAYVLLVLVPVCTTRCHVIVKTVAPSSFKILHYIVKYLNCLKKILDDPSVMLVAFITKLLRKYYEAPKSRRPAVATTKIRRRFTLFYRFYLLTAILMNNFCHQNIIIILDIMLWNKFK